MWPTGTYLLPLRTASEVSHSLESTVTDICNTVGNDQTRMMDILRAVQRQCDCISSAAMDLISQRVNLPRVNVESTVSFYSFLSDQPKGKIVIRLCDDTRVEGHGKVTILLDKQNRVKQARLHIVEFRGFERFVQGRPYWEVPVLVQRLCGICPVSHHLAAAKAVDRIVGAEKLTPTAEKIRRLMHYGQMFQSHALHFFHLCSPDILFGFDADPALRNVVAVAKDDRFKQLAVQGVMMRKYGQEIIKTTAGKKIHGTGAIPGGVNKNLSIEERDGFLKDLDQMLEWSRGAVKIARDYTIENIEQFAPFGSFDSNHMSIIRADGAMDLYDGGLRAVDAEGNTIFDHVDDQTYADYLIEEVKSWSYMKFPFIRSVGPEDGWYRVGPLARINTCDFIDTPLAEAARQEFSSITDGKPCNVTMGYHWARMIEVLHAIERIAELLIMKDGKHVILYVEDDPDFRESVRLVLEHHGYIMVEAPTAEEGLKVYAQANPDLIIVDLIMEEIDAGKSLVRDLKAEGCTVPIVMLSSTGDAMSSMISPAELGLAAVLQKPLDPDRLLHILKTKLQ